MHHVASRNPGKARRVGLLIALLGSASLAACATEGESGPLAGAFEVLPSLDESDSSDRQRRAAAEGRETQSMRESTADPGETSAPKRGEAETGAASDDGAGARGEAGAETASMREAMAKGEKSTSGAERDGPTMTRPDGDRDARDAKTSELTPRYCYRTLAEVECYTAPRPERRRQRVGSFHDTVE